MEFTVTIKGNLNEYWEGEESISCIISLNSCFILDANGLCQSYDRQLKSNLEILEGFSERWNIFYYTYYMINYVRCPLCVQTCIIVNNNY